MKKVFILFLNLVTSIIAFSQTSNLEIMAGPLVDTSDNTTNIIFKKYSDYFTKDKFGKYNIKHWSQKDIDNQKWDISRQHMLSNLIKGNEDNFQLVVLSINKLQDDSFLLTSALYRKNVRIDYSTALLHKVVFIKENKQWVMTNYDTEYKKDWNTLDNKFIQYNYSNYTKIDQHAVDSAEMFLSDLYETLSIPIPSGKIDYTIAKDFNEFSNILGFPYYYFQFSTGITTPWRNSIITQVGAFHAHELVHIVTKDWKHTFVLYEGIATYYGTRLQHPAVYSNKMNLFSEYVKNNANTNLEQVLFGEEQIINMKYNYKYFLGAFFCAFIFDTYGHESLIKVLKMNSRNKDEFLTKVEQTLKIERSLLFSDFRKFIIDYK